MKMFFIICGLGIVTAFSVLFIAIIIKEYFDHKEYKK